MSLKDAVLARVEPAKFWPEYFEGWRPGRNVPCPLAAERHGKGEDRKPSLSLSADGKAFCHACGFKATSPVGLLEEAEGLSFEDACARLWHLAVEPLVPEAWLKERAAELEESEYVLAALEERRGISPGLAKRYGLGWGRGRLVIPIRNAQGLCVDARRYDLFGKFDAKMLPYEKGYGKARLWPLDQLRGREVFLFEGEMDTLLAIQLGLPAATLTSGAMTWRRELNSAFKGKDVFVVPDLDEPGLAGGERRAAEIAKAAASVRILRLPMREGEGKDFTDWVVRGKGSAQTLRALAPAKVLGYRVVNGAEDVDEEGESELTPFKEITKVEELYLRRADATIAHLTSGGAFFRSDQGNLYYAPRGGRTIRMASKGEELLSYLSRVHPLINSATSAGKFVIQHVMNHAQQASRDSHSGSWAMMLDHALYLYAREDKIVRARDGELEVLKNAVNGDKVLLESPPMNRDFEPDLKVSAETAVDLLWSRVVKYLAVNEIDQYLIAAWLLGLFFRHYIKPKPLVRLLAQTASGKSTASKMLSLLVYGDEVLQHSATTTAAIYAMSQSFPFLLFDNIETRNMTPPFEDFLLVAATGGMKAKRQEATDSGVVIEQTGCLVMTNGIEPFVRHELIDRNMEIALDARKFGQQGFNEIRVFAEIRRQRGAILCGLLRLLSKKVMPRIRAGEIQRIAHAFGPHSKSRFNEYLALMSIILDALWEFRPMGRLDSPRRVVEEWLDEQTVSSQRQDEGTNEILYFISTFAERRDRLIDCSLEVKKQQGKTVLRGTTRALLSDFRILAKHLGVRCPWSNERQLGTRLVDAEGVLRKAGWQRELKKIHGKNVYEYVHAGGEDGDA